MLTRKPNWQTCLHDYLHAHATTPFAYGALDCCLFATGAVEAMTGVDLAKPFRGQYDNRREAMRLVRAYCSTGSVKALAEAMAIEHGIAEIDVQHAQRGDVILYGFGSAASLGIVAPHGTEIISVAESGLWRMSLYQGRRAWRIG